LGIHKASVDARKVERNLSKESGGLKGVTKSHWPAELRKIPRLFIHI